MSANQGAVDMLRRMHDTQGWLLAQQEALPELPPGRDGREAFLVALDAFWEVVVAEPGTPAVTRRQALALRLAQVMRDAAALCNNDGSLPDAAADLVAVVLRAGGALPDYLHAEELMVGDVPYAGAVILTDDREPGRVLLFTVEGGWRVFASRTVFYRDIERAMRRELVGRDDLPGVGANDLAMTPARRFLGARALHQDIFGTLAARLIARLRERVVAAFDEPLDPDDGDDGFDHLHAATDFSALLDTYAIVRQRDWALAAQEEDERLAIQPPDVRQHWQRVTSNYRDQWWLDHEAMTIPSLTTFASTALNASLRARGVGTPAHELYVRLTAVGHVLDDAVLGSEQELLSLLDLACRNIGGVTNERLEAIHADGSARADVSAKVLREIVRELDLANAYPLHLADTQGDTPTGRARRAAYKRLLEARMRSEADDARLGYRDSQMPRTFMDDPQELGYRWVQAVLDAPDPAHRTKIDGRAILAAKPHVPRRELVGGREIVVSRLTYKGRALSDILVIAPRQSAAVGRVVVYTPGAPDGRTFREFADRATMKREFLIDLRFEPYLLDRLPTDFAAVDGDGSRHFARTILNGGRDWSWVFNTADCSPASSCTQLEANFEEREVLGSFLDSEYGIALELARRNATIAATRSDFVTLTGFVGRMASSALPYRLGWECLVAGVRSIPRLTQAAWRFHDQVKAGEGNAAFLTFVEGYTSALNVFPMFAQIPAAVGARMRATPGAIALVPTQRTLPAPDTLFGKRFLASGVSAPNGKNPASGVYRIDGHRYIRQGRDLHHVRFDPRIDGWRLSRPDAPEARDIGPAVERMPDGQWRFRRA